MGFWHGALRASLLVKLIKLQHAIADYELKEVLVHDLPYFNQERDIQVMSQITSGNHPEWPDNATDTSTRQDFRDLCGRCWSKDPNDRPAMRDVVTHLNFIASWLSNFGSKRDNGK